MDSYTHKFFIACLGCLFLCTDMVGGRIMSGAEETEDIKVQKQCTPNRQNNLLKKNYQRCLTP